LWSARFHHGDSYTNWSVNKKKRPEAARSPSVIQQQSSIMSASGASHTPAAEASIELD
jgi:hypothetical protein